MVLFVILISILIGSIIYSYPNYKYYKLLYSRIPYLDYYETYDHDIWLEDPDLDLLVFDDNTARFNSYHYLYLNFLNWCDPYTLYWKIKVDNALNKRRLQLKL